MGIRKGLLVVLLLAVLAVFAFSAEKQKVILDTDMVFGFDDGICILSSRKV